MKLWVKSKILKRKYVQRQIGKDPTIWLESNELDPFRIGKDMTERKMPVTESLALLQNLNSILGYLLGLIDLDKYALRSLIKHNQIDFEYKD